MNNSYTKLPNGYEETIAQGIRFVRTLSGQVATPIHSLSHNLQKLKQALTQADAIVIGGGAGLSSSAGMEYSGERFLRYFFDFSDHFGIQDIYSGGFYPFPDEETRWAWWARHIYYNRYNGPPTPLYPKLLELVMEKNFFVITTNVDHQFERAGFPKERLFCTQGDYGSFQSVNPVHQFTINNEEWVRQAMAAQGFVKSDEGIFEVPKDRKLLMKLPPDLVPKFPLDNSRVKMHLRSDQTFLQDEAWHKASAAYHDFLKVNNEKQILFLELGVGMNTPVIIKYPFWQMTHDFPQARYACVNVGESYAPLEISERSSLIETDIKDVVSFLSDNK